ncbi:hypothetical protein CCR94_18650 [Rhodoblastus sphagnicola]|uniref:Uncharacterized protein n=2 Tax=Rhodoblastus sphagnicola TaxID=333368 RepID=A0A2S6N0E1_9HYPH|nr:hypothetical protein CCR94_18650 [Rhodoblastus sphagnicola]
MRVRQFVGEIGVDLCIKLGEKEDFLKVYDGVDPRDPALFTENTFDEAVPPCGKMAKRAV